MRFFIQPPLIHWPIITHRLTEETKESTMIYEVSGDLLLTGAKAIAHGIAPNDHFDHGLAMSIREAWPSVAKDFRHYSHQTHPHAGELWVWSGVGGVRFFNLMTQDGDHGHGSKPGRATTANVNHCLKRLRHELDKGEVASIAMPKLATGVGGLSWSEVKPLIEQHLGSLAIPVYIYTEYHKGVKANEPQ